MIGLLKRLMENNIIKICSQCKITGLRWTFARGSRCLTCHKAYHKNYKKEWRIKNKEKNKSYNLQWNKDHPEERKAIQKRSREKNKEKYKPKQKFANKKYREEHRQDISVSNKNWRNKNKEYVKEQKKLYYEENKDHLLKLAKLRYEKNKKKINAQKYQWRKDRLKKDPAFRCMNNASRQANLMLHSQVAKKNGGSFIQSVGYTCEELCVHLEKQFTPEMNWENYGTYWHMDHIVPHSHTPYDSMNHPNFKKAWCLENLRPLEAVQNMSEGNRR